MLDMVNGPLRITRVLGITNNGFVLDVSDGKAKRDLSNSCGQAKPRYFGDFLYICGSVAVISNPMSCACDRILIGHKSPILRVSISPNHTLIFSIDIDRQVLIWNLNSSTPIGATASYSELLYLNEIPIAYSVQVEGTRMSCGAFGPNVLYLMGFCDAKAKTVLFNVAFELEEDKLKMDKVQNVSYWFNEIGRDHLDMKIGPKSTLVSFGQKSAAVVNTRSLSLLYVEFRRDKFQIVSAGVIEGNKGKVKLVVINNRGFMWSQGPSIQSRTSTIFYTFPCIRPIGSSVQNIIIGPGIGDEFPYRGFNLNLNYTPVVEFGENTIVIGAGSAIRVYDYEFVLRRKVECIDTGPITHISVRDFSRSKSPMAIPDLIATTASPPSIVLFESEGQFVRIVRRFPENVVTQMTGRVGLTNMVEISKMLPILLTIDECNILTGTDISRMYPFAKGRISAERVNFDLKK
ncbi:hypothetical protein ACOME3_004820 [Neoechinorhynchus agilis]